MSKLAAFKKHEIKDMNKVQGGGINYSTTSSVTGWTATDTWYLFRRNNDTGSGHTDTGNDWS